MSIEKPRSRLLGKYVAGFYAFHEVEEYPRHYKIYPNPNTAVALYRNASVACSDCKLGFAAGNDTGVILTDRYRKSCHVTYENHVDEVVIMFKGAGINLFFPDYYSGFEESGVFDLYRDPEWRDLAASFKDVWQLKSFARDAEDFLLERVQYFDELDLLEAYLNRLSRFEDFPTITEVSEGLGHPTTLARMFNRFMGCTPREYRKILKYRRAIHLRLREGDSRNLGEIGSVSGFYDQAHFIRNFKSLTDETPREYFKSVTAVEDHIFLKPS